MAKVINRDVPIAEENTTLTGQPASNMYDDCISEQQDQRTEGTGCITRFHCPRKKRVDINTATK